MSDAPKTVSKGFVSTIADKHKAGWGDQKQTHSCPPDERFMTENKQAYKQSSVPLSEAVGGCRRPRHYEEFTKHYDKVNLSRSSGNLAKAGSLVVRPSLATHCLAQRYAARLV